MSLTSRTKSDAVSLEVRHRDGTLSAYLSGYTSTMISPAVACPPKSRCVAELQASEQFWCSLVVVFADTLTPVCSMDGAAPSRRRMGRVDSLLDFISPVGGGSMIMSPVQELMQSPTVKNRVRLVSAEPV